VRSVLVSRTSTRGDLTPPWALTNLLRQNIQAAGSRRNTLKETGTAD
jgi:hypothetical protein